MSIDSILDHGCSCHLGHAPCVYCTNTYECEECGDRVITEDQCELGQELVTCDDCIAQLDEDRDDTGKLMVSIRQAAEGQ